MQDNKEKLPSKDKNFSDNDNLEKGRRLERDAFNKFENVSESYRPTKDNAGTPPIVDTTKDKKE